jgi:hypothetical protein
MSLPKIRAKLIEVLWQMPIPTAHQASNSDRVSLRRLLCATAGLPAAGLALMLAFTPEESAAAEVYTTAPGSHLDFAFDGHSEAVTGQFTLDAADTSVFSVDLVLSGISPKRAPMTNSVRAGRPDLSPAQRPRAPISTVVPVTTSGLPGLPRLSARRPSGQPEIVRVSTASQQAVARIFRCPGSAPSTHLYRVYGSRRASPFSAPLLASSASGNRRRGCAACSVADDNKPRTA